MASRIGLHRPLGPLGQLIGGLLQAAWAINVGVFLPSSLGSTMYSPFLGVGAPGSEFISLEPWQAALALLGWVVIALAGGSALIKSRDV